MKEGLSGGKSQDLCCSGVQRLCVPEPELLQLCGKEVGVTGQEMALRRPCRAGVMWAIVLFHFCCDKEPLPLTSEGSKFIQLTLPGYNLSQ